MDKQTLNLNPEQKQVSMHKKGSLLVTAGPGSGKTRVIAERAISLMESGVPQESILCITFTKKAANEMRERLADKINVKVATYHAFSKEILTDNATESGVGSNTVVFEEWAQKVWCHKNTDEFGFDPKYVNVAGNADRTYASMLEAVRKLKEEMIPPQKLQEYVDRELNGAGEDSDHIKIIHRLDQVAKLYRAYEDYKRTHHLIDYTDMVSEAVALLDGNRTLLSEYRKRFRYIMIDEFQDNNYVQFRLARLLVGDNDNVMAVGDENQSIMGFQGAYSEVFDDYRSEYSNPKEISLAENYRSTRNLMRLANMILDDDAGGMDDGPNRAGDDVSDGDKIHVIRTPTEAGQIEFVIKTIRDIMKNGVTDRLGHSRRDLSYSDIAILSRRNDEGQAFINALRSHGIPVSSMDSPEFLSNPYVAELVAYLKVANSPESEGAMMYDLLRSVDVPEDEWTSILDDAARARRRSDDNFRDLVWHTMKERRSSEAHKTSPELDGLIYKLDEIIKMSRFHTIHDLINEICIKTGLFMRALDEQDDKGLRLLVGFHDMAVQYGRIFVKDSLGDFLSAVSGMGDFNVETEDSDHADAVNVMTIHKSKGKEFSVVFITDMVDKKFPTRYRERMFPIPAELLQYTRKKTPQEQTRKDLHEKEERRLFYVAATRAKSSLYMISPRRYDGNSGDSHPSKFLADLEYESNPLIKVTEFAATRGFDVQPADSAAAQLQKKACNAIGRSDYEVAVRSIARLARMQGGSSDADSLIDAITDEYKRPRPTKRPEPVRSISVSASSIRLYEECPYKFKLSNVYRIPSKPRPALSFGSAVHSAIEDATKKRRPEDVTKEDIMERYWSNLGHAQEQSRTKTAMYVEKAEKIIQAYRRLEAESKNDIVDTEFFFKVMIDGVQCRGRIDRLERNPRGRYELIDYKTGKNVLSASKAKSDPQLNIYAKAVEALHGALPEKASLVYLEEGRATEYLPTAESVSSAMESIKITISDMRSSKFEATPSYRACQWCEYNRICKYSAV